MLGLASRVPLARAPSPAARPQSQARQLARGQPALPHSQRRRAVVLAAVRREKATKETDSRLQVPDTPPAVASSPDQQQEQEPQQQQQPAQPVASQSQDDLLSSIDELQRRRAQLETEKKKESLAEGVLEEVRLIKWPTPQQALVQTLLVVAIVAATSVLLFTVNTLLTELSQAVYR